MYSIKYRFQAWICSWKYWF